ncbi:hypothetical protein GTY59_00100 [Streptomyces sp. SID5466]|nr:MULTISPECIES: hypothetical protein [Streptomyces]MYR76908.1 hypothetical protein [Streptomyces sp. SID5466]MYR76923.1 hypothetical protein [Streptomyces sp. SID5466]
MTGVPSALSSENLMEQLIKKMAEDGIWQNWIAVNSVQGSAKSGCISAAPKNGCISAAPKAGCIS